MGRLTIDIPDNAHHHLKVMAASRGVTMREYFLEKIAPDLATALEAEVSLGELAARWEERRKDFKLERGERSLAQVIHEGHQW